MTEPRRPSSDTVPIDRRALLEQMAERGEAEPCPACATDGYVSPRVAKRVRAALPVTSSDRPTLPELPADEDTKP